MRGSVTDEELGSFRHLVLEQGRILWRDLPWRETRDPYAIWISEVMLQQTQVQRVLGRWERWLERFPDVESLAQVPTADVLQEWQGMGYNRRALALHEAAQKISELGSFPTGAKELAALPGIGPTTAAGIRAFAFDLPGIYLDTNVRTVFLHELFPDDTAVPDKAIAPLVERCCPKTAEDPTDDPRTWYYALLDFGAYLKRVAPNPSEGLPPIRSSRSSRDLIARRGQPSFALSLQQGMPGSRPRRRRVHSLPRKRRRGVPLSARRWQSRFSMTSEMRDSVEKLCKISCLMGIRINKHAERASRGLAKHA